MDSTISIHSSLVNSLIKYGIRAFISYSSNGEEILRLPTIIKLITNGGSLDTVCLIHTFGPYIKRSMIQRNPHRQFVKGNVDDVKSPITFTFLILLTYGIYVHYGLKSKVNN